MLALYRSGRQAEALEAYQDARRVLVEELGIEPGRELRELHQAILRQDPTSRPRCRTCETPRSRLPRPDSSVVSAELAELGGGLDEAFAGRARLFLIQGEPGIGKSRLADEVTAPARRPRGAHVLVGRCWEAGGAPAVLAVDAVAASVRAREPSRTHAAAAGWRRRRTSLRSSPSSVSCSPGSPGPGAARVRGRALSSLRLDRVASPERWRRRRRSSLVLDDLHAADEPSLLLLRYVASRARRRTDPVARDLP